MYKVFEVFDVETRQKAYEIFIALPLPKDRNQNWREYDYSHNYKACMCPIGACLIQINSLATALPSNIYDINYYVNTDGVTNEDVVEFIERNDRGEIVDLADAMGVA